MPKCLNLVTSRQHITKSVDLRSANNDNNLSAYSCEFTFHRHDRENDAEVQWVHLIELLSLIL